MRSIVKSAVFLLALFATNILHAQLPLSRADLVAIEATTPVPADELPSAGAYYSAKRPQNPPAPANIFGFSAWVVDADAGIYLLDDFRDSFGGGFHADDSDPVPPDDGDGAAAIFTNTYSGFPTNGLWLQITNMAEGWLGANLNGATDCVYEIFSTTNLSLPMAVSNWNIETEVFPGVNTNTAPFNVPMNGRNPLFLWARDWTGITSCGNTTPEWWFWRYYGMADLSDTNLDSVGQELLLDYQHGIDPNIIFFTLQLSNVVHSVNFNGNVTVGGGVPFYEAVLVNDTNTADALWQPYTGTNVSVSLNSGNGLYTVSVGLKGLPANATTTWLSTQVTLEVPVLTLSVTNPVTSTVSQPVIQLQGLVSETLSNLTFEVSNALTVITNQQGYWGASFFDTNVADFTTNNFQCYDIPLTNGLNVITLQATDLYGNTATTNVNITLDYSGNTNPPALSILWPQNGTPISGSNFTLQAQVSDDTATVTAQITGSGDTNIIQGLVERSGTVLVNNLPLAAGTNSLTITATDAGGYSTTTNLTLVQSSVLVTMNPLSGSQFNQASVTVTGTISATNYDVSVNGIEAAIHCDGTWQACMVPVSPTGTARFDVEIYSGDPVREGSQNFNQPQPPVVGLMSYLANSYSFTASYNNCGLGGNVFATTICTTNWLYQSGGTGSTSISATGATCTPESNGSSTTSLSGGYNGYGPTWEINNMSGGFYSPPVWQYDPYLGTWLYLIYYEIGTSSSSVNSTVMIMPSDQAAVGQKALYLVSAQVLDEDTGNQLPGSSLHFANQLPGSTVTDVTNGDGSVWSQFIATGPAATNLAVTPLAAGRNISFNGMQVATLSLTVVSNSAVQINGTTNWAAVESTSNYVIVQAMVDTTSAALLASVETNIQWSGGTPVPGNPLQCEVSTAVSTNTVVTATFGSASNSLEVWVIWSTVEIVTSGANPTNAPSFIPAGESNQLGVVYYNNTNSAAGQICTIATITPVGIHSVITNGWNFFQYRMSHDFNDGQPDLVYFDSTWQSDGPHPDFKTIIPDSGDMLYTIDGPNIQIFENTNSSETYNNYHCCPIG